MFLRKFAFLFRILLLNFSNTSCICDSLCRCFETWLCDSHTQFWKVIDIVSFILFLFDDFQRIIESSILIIFVGNTNQNKIFLKINHKLLQFIEFYLLQSFQASISSLAVARLEEFIEHFVVIMVLAIFMCFILH